MASRVMKFVLLLCIANACFAAVTITGVSPNPSTTTSTTVNLAGSGFNGITVDTVTIAGVECGSPNVVDDNTLSCLAEPGLGQGVKVVITTTSGDKHSANVVNFAPAAVAPCEAEFEEIFVANANVPVKICGSGFSTKAATTDKSEYTGRFDVSVAGFKATVTSHTDTQIIATLPAAAGVKQNIKVTFGTQTLVVPNVVATYPAPQVSNVKEDVVAKRSVTTRVGVYGKHFGTPSPLTHVTVKIGAFSCVNIHHVSDSEIHCTVNGGFGANVPVVVTVNGQPSAAPGATGAPAVRFDFADTTTPGLSCVPPFGAADAINPELCNCWAGSAPSSSLYADCDVHAICPGRITSSTTVSQFPPSRPVTEFKDDKLYVTQTMPIVKNRRDTIIQFVVPITAANGTIGESTCWYPGTIWAKSVNELDCLDTYVGVLQWSQNAMCGFVEDAAAATTTTIFYKTSLVTTYTETFKTHDGALTFRKISNAYLLSVSFRRQVQVLTHTSVNVYINDPNLEVAVIGDALYDVASKNTIITFETTIVWPYQIPVYTLVGTWKKALGNTDTGSEVVATAVLAPLQPGELQCDFEQDSSCGQSWILTIQTQPDINEPEVCNLYGLVEFSTGNLDCRDTQTAGYNCPGSPSTNFTLSIGATDLCDGDHDVDASLGLTHVLESYFDSAFTVPQNTFQTGDMVFFKLTINDPISTIDQVTFNEILLRGDNTDRLYLVQNPGDLPTDTDTFMHTDAQFNITQEIRVPYIAVGHDGVLTFNFRLLRNQLDSIRTLSSGTPEDMAKQLTVEATIDILYHGNQKRTLVASGSLPTVSHAQFSFYDVPEVEDELETNEVPVADEQVNELAGLFASSASATVVSFVGVAVAVAALLA